MRSGQHAANKLDFTSADFEAAVGEPLERFVYSCHQASLALIKSGVLGRSRVARGFCRGVGGQHSWVVLGDDCYDREATIVDPTLWCYADEVEGIWIGTMSERPHVPHGAGSIWEWGKPTSSGGPIIELEREGLSAAAQFFLDMLGPLDLHGWSLLAQAPVEEWPAGEILAAMYRHPVLGARVPIDRVGMTTEINPNGLYLPGGEQPV